MVCLAECLREYSEMSYSPLPPSIPCHQPKPIPPNA